MSLVQKIPIFFFLLFFALFKALQCTILVAKTKALIRFAVTANCAFVFASADCWFSHAAAEMLTDVKVLFIFIFLFLLIPRHFNRMGN